MILGAAKYGYLGDISNDLRMPLTIVKDLATIVKEGTAGPNNKEQQHLLERSLIRAEELNLLHGRSDRIHDWGA